MKVNYEKIFLVDRGRFPPALRGCDYRAEGGSMRPSIRSERFWETIHRSTVAYRQRIAPYFPLTVVNAMTDLYQLALEDRFNLMV